MQFGNTNAMLSAFSAFSAFSPGCPPSAKVKTMFVGCRASTIRGREEGVPRKPGWVLRLLRCRTGGRGPIVGGGFDWGLPLPGWPLSVSQR